MGASLLHPSFRVKAIWHIVPLADGASSLHSPFRVQAVKGHLNTTPHKIPPTSQLNRVMLFPHDESINRLALQHNHRLDHCEEVGMPSHRASLGPSACAPFAFIQCFDETALTPSSTCPRLSQSPELVCFHSETTSSPLEMARIVPVIDQLTRQTGAEKMISLYWHCSPAIFGKVHTTTFLS